MLPVLSREVVEGKQRVAILDQALDSLVVFDAPSFDEGVERGECILLGLGHPNLLERTLGLRLLALGQLVQDIGGLVHPTALAARPRPYLLDCLLHDCVLSRTPSMITSRHCAASSSRACTWMPSTQK